MATAHKLQKPLDQQLDGLVAGMWVCVVHLVPDATWDEFGAQADIQRAVTQFI